MKTLFLPHRPTDAERETYLRRGLQQHTFGRYLARINEDFVSSALKNAPMSVCLHLGTALPEMPAVPESVRSLLQTAGEPENGAHPDVVAAYDCLPWAAQSADMVCWPHGLDICAHAQFAVQALSRVVVPGGRVILTGLNAGGYWRLRYGHVSWLRQMRCRTPQEVTAQFGEYGFVLMKARFLGYRLYTRHWSPQAAVELMGNRWWPHLAAMYGFVFVKQSTILTPLQPWRNRAADRRRLDCGATARRAR